MILPPKPLLLQAISADFYNFFYPLFSPINPNPWSITIELSVPIRVYISLRNLRNLRLKNSRQLVPAKAGIRVYISLRNLRNLRLKNSSNDIRNTKQICV